MATYRKSRRTFVAAGAAALAFNIVPGRARAAQYNFRCASNNPNENSSSKRIPQMWAEIEKESGGRIHCQFFPNSELGGDAAMFSQLRLGAIQFFLSSAGNLATVVPAADIMNLGFAYKDSDEGARVVDGPLGNYLRNETTAKNIHSLRSVWNNGMSQIISATKPIQSPDDLHGFKVRVTESKILVELFRGLGASPTPLSMGETYTAFQTKIIDGESLSLGTIKASRHYEVSKYISLTSHAWSGPWMLANGDMWKSLPADLQEIIERNNTKYAVIQRRDTTSGDASTLTQLAAQGLRVNQVEQEPYRERLKSYYESWRGTFGTTSWGLLQSTLGRRIV